MRLPLTQNDTNFPFLSNSIPITSNKPHRCKSEQYRREAAAGHDAATLRSAVLICTIVPTDAGRHVPKRVVTPDSRIVCIKAPAEWPRFGEIAYTVA